MHSQRLVGYDFVHAVVDDHSRLAHVEFHRDERATTVTGFVERALAFYERHDQPRSQRSWVGQLAASVNMARPIARAARGLANPLANSNQNTCKSALQGGLENR
jgi:hypothetical protein